MVHAQTAPDVREILASFLERTGVDPPTASTRRYLWTDSFAVCTLIGLARITGDPHPLDQAVALSQRVHGILGRHRDDDPRTGWLSGLAEDRGRARPTCAGLRIGKPLPERGADEPFNAALEWERDGQYFHYLTKWTHALLALCKARNDDRYVRWAVELAHVAHARFTYSPAGSRRRRMVWKMSIDLTRPLVASMGQHDPLDGLLTLRAVQALARERGVATDCLDDPIEDFRTMCAGVDWTTPDPLGLGGLLFDSLRLVRLAQSSPADADLTLAVLDAAATGLLHWARTTDSARAPEERLAFRELGLAIGLSAVPHIDSMLNSGDPRPADADAMRRRLDSIRRFEPVAASITSFWSDPAHQTVASWQSHLDINAVTLAAALLPDGFLCP